MSSIRTISNYQGQKKEKKKSNNLVDRAKSTNRFIFITRKENAGRGGLRLMSGLKVKQMEGKDTNISASCFPHPSHPWRWMRTDTNGQRNDSKEGSCFSSSINRTETIEREVS